MPERPVLIMPHPEEVPKKKKGFGRDIPPEPTYKTKQAQKLEEQFSEIKNLFISDEPGDIEKVLVMEATLKMDNLRNAVRHVKGLEWLAEIDMDANDRHYELYNEKDRKKIKVVRFYVISSNKAAINKLHSLWKNYQKKEKFPRDFGVFKELFKYCINLRRWNARDRMKDTGILKSWEEEYNLKKETGSYMNFEIELHYHKSQERRDEYVHQISQEIEDRYGEEGNIRKEVCIQSIAFHALKITLPVDGIERVLQCNLDNDKTLHELPSFFNSEAIRYFRPIGQHININENAPLRPLKKRLTPPEKNKEPILALLDGAPMPKHELIEDYIYLVDPDNYAEAYDPWQKKHGTAMASLICHGDLGGKQHEIGSLTRPIYIRPIMKPNKPGNSEEIPFDIFQEDIVEQAVREMYEGQDPIAPQIRIINLSLGNFDQIYLHHMSPWARLLDWLAFKYNVLFIVSAGNYLESIRCTNSNSNTHETQMHFLEHNEQQRILNGIDKNQRNHRLYSPAESMNALTVGALQEEESDDLSISHDAFNPFKDNKLPAPYSRIGPGYRSSIKPDIFAPGGKLLYQKIDADNNSIKPVNTQSSGIRVSCPKSSMPEQSNSTTYGVGTSHATAIVSHGAGHIFEMLETLRTEDHDTILTYDLEAILIKALLVHSASHYEYSYYYNHLQGNLNSDIFKQYRSRYVGYGNIHIKRVLECTKNRVTTIYCKKIQKNQRYCFSFPIPKITIIKNYVKLTITLAWFSPINQYHIGVRRAKLFFENDKLSNQEFCTRMESHRQQVRNGTVQHEIFELDKYEFSENPLEIFIECSKDAGSLDDEIPYALAITLEVAEAENIDIYQLVKNKIEQRVSVMGNQKYV